MTRPIVKWRPAGSLRPEHLAEAARALAREGHQAEAEALQTALLTARALPVALDVIADGRAGMGVARMRLSLVAMRGPGALPVGPLLAVGVLEAPGVEVRFFDEERREQARLHFALDEDPSLDDAPLLRRFVHGPRGT